MKWNWLVVGEFFKNKIQIKLSYALNRVNKRNLTSAVTQCIVSKFFQIEIIEKGLASTGIEPATFALLARRSNQLS